MRSSVHLGAVVEIPILEFLAAQPEVLYSFQGYKFENDETRFEEETLKLDYLYIPVVSH